MKKIYYSFIGILISFVCTDGNAQTNICPSAASGIKAGSAANVLTFLRNDQNQIIYNKATDGVVFIHRNNPTAFGGISGNLRLDYSKDGGYNWTADAFNLNPGNTSNNPSRYPQVALFNPSGNTVFDSMFAVYVSATTNNTNWIGYNYGVMQLNSSASPTENYVTNSNITNTLITGSLIESQPGTFWATDVIDSTPRQGWRIYKGVYNSSSRDVDWATSTEIRPNFFNSAAPQAVASAVHFDPTGKYGWFVGLTHLSGLINTQRIYPYFWMTTDSGNSWTGPIEVDWNMINGTLPGNGSVTAGGFECDLTVDSLGNPHLLMDISTNSGAGGGSYTINAISKMHAMYDLTYDGTAWQAYKLKDLFTFRGTFTPGQTWSHDTHPQAGRTTSGGKVFFTWLDADSAGSNANLNSRIQGCGYDIVKHCWTPVINFTKCSGYSDTVFIHTMSPIVRDSADIYDLPIMVMKQKGSAITPPDFYYLKGARITDADFNITRTTIGFAGNTPKLCGGGITLYAYPLGASYTWSNGANTQSITVNTAGNYAVTVSGCSTDSANIDVLPNVVIDLTVSGSTALCNGSSVDLTINNNASILWSTGDTVATITVSNGGWISYTVSDTCGSVTDSIYITPSPSQKINITGNTQICPGDSLVLDATNNWSSYTWSNNQTGPSIIVKQTGSYSVTLSDTNGCTFESDTVVVTQKPTPTASIQMSSPGFCPGDSVLLMTSSNSKYVYQWYYNGNAVPNSDNDSIYTNSAGSYKIHIVDTSSGCSAISGNLNVSAYTNPTAAINASGANRFCAGGNVTLDAGSAGSVSYQWIKDGVAIQGANSNTYQAKASGDYKVKVTSNKGCAATSNTIAVTVDSVPTPIIYKNSTGICQGDSLLMYTNGNQNYSYQWKLNGTNITNATDSLYYTTTTGVYTVTALDNTTSCSATSASVNINIYNKPAVSITASGSTKICQGQTVNLDAGNTSGLTYQWNKDGNPLSGANGNTFSAAESGKYTVEATNSNGCKAISNSITLTVDSLPDVQTALSNSKTSFCADDSTIISIKDVAGNTYIWYNGTNIISGATTSSLKVKVTGIYKVQVTSSAGCNATSSSTSITVFPLPQATITSANQKLNASTGSGYSYQWYKNGSLLNGDTLATYTPVANGDYYVVITDDNGCSNNSNTINVNWLGLTQPDQLASIFIYPNPSSGIFQVQLEMQKAEYIYMTVYNSLGEQVYRSNCERSIGKSMETIDISKLASGIYWLSIQSQNQILSYKLIKK